MVRDAQGIAQVYADTDADLLRAQGYVHAQERFFEMDVRRHVTGGRLSELFGPDGLETDKVIRTMGWRRVAEQELAILDTETREALTAYAAGVNAYLETHGTTEIAVEYTLLAATGLSYEPEPWTPVDSLAWLKAMAWDLRGNMTDEVDRVVASLDHTPDEVAQLYPDYPFDAHPPIVGSGGVVDGVFEQNASGNATRNPRRPAYSSEMVDALEGVRDTVAGIPDLMGRGDGIGSNSWVVDGEHSATGSPLLANDPHLGVSMPGIWLQMGLHCRTVSPDCTLDTSGFTFSGVPGVIIGHNADIAWGFTNLGPDVTDLYLEKVEGESWIQDGERRPLEVRTETIEVRGEDDFELQIRETAHGPLISDVSQELSLGGGQRADRRAGPDRSRQRVRRRAGVDRPRARHHRRRDPRPRPGRRLGRVPGGRRRLRRTGAEPRVRRPRGPHRLPGARAVIPIRKSGNDGRMPAEGWVSANDWTGDHVPFDGLPSVLDPEEGFIVTANQAVVGPDYPYFLTDDWDRGYRSTRIRQVLEQEGELSIDEMARLQLDTTNPMAATLVPYLLDVQDLPSDYYRDGQELLADWDFTQPADSAAAAYYNVVWSNLLRLTFHDELPEKAWPDGGDRWFGVVEQLLGDPAGPWWDDVETDGIESRDDLLRQALMDARDEMTRRQALDPDGVDVGPPAPARPARLDAGGVRHRAGRAPAQPRRLRGRRRLEHRRRDLVGRHRGLRGHLRALDADGRLAGRPGPVPLDQPHRGLRAPRLVALRRPDPAVGRRGVPPLGLLPCRGRGGGRGHHDPRAGPGGRLTVVATDAVSPARGPRSG